MRKELVTETHDNSRRAVPVDIDGPGRSPYPSDLTDAEWSALEPLLPQPSRVGRPRKVNMREVVNAICFIQRTGVQWRQLPHDFPKWQTVYFYYREWRIHGVWDKVSPIIEERPELAS